MLCRRFCCRSKCYSELTRGMPLPGLFLPISAGNARTGSCTVQFPDDIVRLVFGDDTPAESARDLCQVVAKALQVSKALLGQPCALRVVLERLLERLLPMVKGFHTADGSLTTPELLKQLHSMQEQQMRLLFSRICIVESALYEANGVLAASSDAGEQKLRTDAPWYGTWLDTKTDAQMEALRQTFLAAGEERKSGKERMTQQMRSFLAEELGGYPWRGGFEAEGENKMKVAVMEASRKAAALGERYRAYSLRYIDSLEQAKTRFFELNTHNSEWYRNGEAAIIKEVEKETFNHRDFWTDRNKAYVVSLNNLVVINWRLLRNVSVEKWRLLLRNVNV